MEAYMETEMLSREKNDQHQVKILNFVYVM